MSPSLAPQADEAAESLIMVSNITGGSRQPLRCPGIIIFSSRPLITFDDGSKRSDYSGCRYRCALLPTARWFVAPRDAWLSAHYGDIARRCARRFFFIGAFQGFRRLPSIALIGFLAFLFTAPTVSRDARRHASRRSVMMMRQKRHIYLAISSMLTPRAVFAGSLPRILHGGDLRADARLLDRRADADSYLASKSSGLSTIFKHTTVL